MVANCFRNIDRWDRSIGSSGSGRRCGSQRRQAAPDQFRTRRPADPRRKTASRATAPTIRHAKPACGSTPRKGLLRNSKSGGRAIVPGKPDESELIVRIESDDPELHMPPKKSGKQLTADQIATLRRWIEQGAAWTTHWSFDAPKKPRCRPSRTPRSAINEIDRFILARLEAEGLSPSPMADKTTLIRRVTLDLTGLPPTLQEVDAFLADASEEAYEKVVDRLLDSPRYGEHMARFWLDAARYGDTHGLHLDNYREAWPYRDWVIKAFNANKPFDRFIVEQLAGDLLPNATPDQFDRHRLQSLPRVNQ